MLGASMLCVNLSNRLHDCQSGNQRKQQGIGGSQRRTQHDGAVNSRGTGRMPRVPATASAGKLLFAEEDRAFWFACGGSFEGCGVGGRDLEVMVDMMTQRASPQHGRKDLRQEKIRNFLQLITSRRVAGNVNTETAQLLDQAPHFGPAGADLISDFGTAHDDRSVIAQRANDATEALVGGLRSSGNDRGLLAQAML